MPGKGNSLTLPEKEMIVNIKHYFDKEKKLHTNKKSPSIKSSVTRTALATNLSEITIYKKLSYSHCFSYKSFRDYCQAYNGRVQ